MQLGFTEFRHKAEPIKIVFRRDMRVAKNTLHGRPADFSLANRGGSAMKALSTEILRFLLNYLKSLEIETS